MQNTIEPFCKDNYKAGLQLYFALFRSDMNSAPSGSMINSVFELELPYIAIWQPPLTFKTPLKTLLGSANELK